MKRVTVTITLALCFLLAWAIGASHATTPWQISGIYLEACRCDMPCPHVLEPTETICQGFSNLHIVRGFYGDVTLDGLDVTVMTEDSPGPVDDADWIIATYVPEQASPEQVEAIQHIIQEWLGVVVAEDLGIKSVPISFEMSGDTYKLNIPDILEIESVLVRDMPSVPGYDGQLLHQAQAVVQKYTDYGREWDFSGKNSWQGRLLLPAEEPSDAIVGTIRVGVSPFGVAVNPYTRMAVTADVVDETISLVDLDTQKVTKTIPLGKFPLGPVINPYTNIAVIPNRGDNTVSFVDLASDTVTKTIPVGEFPGCAGIDAGRNIVAL